MISIDKTKVSKIDLSGRGGGEKSFAPLLEGFDRVSAPLWDFQNKRTKIELKKQRDLQWFDIGKYHNLSESNKNIIMMFVIHDGKNIEDIGTISLGRFLNILYGDDEYRRHGWTERNVEMCHYQKRKFPSMQAKVPLKVKKFIKKYRDEFDIIFSIENLDK